MKTLKDFRNLIQKESSDEDIFNLNESKFAKLQSELQKSETKDPIETVDQLAKAATEDINKFTKDHNQSLSKGSREHHFVWNSLAGKAQIAHVIAGHLFPKDSSGQMVHFDAAKKYAEIQALTKKHLFKRGE